MIIIIGGVLAYWLLFVVAAFLILREKETKKETKHEDHSNHTHVG